MANQIIDLFKYRWVYRCANGVLDTRQNIFGSDCYMINDIVHKLQAIVFSSFTISSFISPAGLCRFYRILCNEEKGESSETPLATTTRRVKRRYNNI